MRARFLAEARREFLAEVRYYNAASSGMGATFVTAVESTVRRAVAFPDSGSPGIEGTRRLIVRGFPFTGCYLVDNDLLVVIAIAHHAREPNYWSRRTS